MNLDQLRKRVANGFQPFTLHLSGPGITQVVATNRVVIRTPTPTRSPTTPPATAEFSWAAVEAEDYRQYIANLRAIDCPEETIRDIIIADVNKLYAPREAPFKALQNYPPPWETRVSTNETVSVAESRKDYERHRQLREVENEKNALLKELLDIE